MAGPEVSVVLPTAGRRDLRATLGAARRACHGVDAELVLAVDATTGTDARRRVADAATAAGAMLADADGPGASGTRNGGWRASRAPVVLFVDDDVLLDPGAVAAHRDAHAAGGGPRATIGRVRWPDDRRITAFERWVEPALQFGYHEIPADGRTGWWQVVTCDCAIRREHLEAVGGLDAERFPFGYEDLDLGLRLEDHTGGLEVLLLPGGGGIHDTRMTLGEWRSRIARIARAERTWDAVHPESPATLRGRFDRVLATPSPRSGPLAARLADVVPEGTPVLGPAVRRRAEAWWEHELAAGFDAAWRDAAD